MEIKQLHFLMMEFTQERVKTLRKEYHMEDDFVPVQQLYKRGSYIIRGGEDVTTDGLRDVLCPIPIVCGQTQGLSDVREELPSDQRDQMVDLAHRLNDIVDSFSRENRAAVENHATLAPDRLTPEEATFLANICGLRTVNIHLIAHLLHCSRPTRQTLQIALDFIIANSSGSLSIGLALDLYATLLAMRYLTSDEVTWVCEWMVNYVCQRLPNWMRFFNNGPD